MNFLKKNKGVLLISIILVISFWGVFQYVFQAPKQIEAMEVLYSGTSKNFINLLDKNPLKWNNKPIALSGKITELVENNFIMDGFVFCQLKETHEVKSLPKLNDEITIKGIVVGYDELLNELKINQCIIKN
ncbi:hypothetical protein [Tenacibaculum xiamenense]|uniref:hypothetical protein n=1 Tax=Tenacibaculum xiamenense TaxID=1261553 RepID=UPI003894773C